MGCAFPAVRSPDVLEEFRAMSHGKLDEWIEAMESEFANNPSTSLKGLSELIQDTRSQFLSAVMKAAIERLYPEYLHQQWAECPGCNRTVRRKRFEPKELSTMQGSFTVDRPYFYCTLCRYGFYPLDEALEIAPQRHQFDIQERVTTTAARVPFGESTEVFAHNSGVTVGSHFSHKTLNAVGQVATVELVIPDADEIARRIEQAVQGGQVAVLVVSSDGALAPTRPKACRKAKRGKGAYKEAKGFRAYLLEHNDRIRHIASWHQIEEGEAIADALKLLAHRLARDKVRVVLIGDGASWVWKVMVENFPDAPQILDFYHCFQHLYAVAKLQFDQDTPQGHQWAEATMIRLCEGHVDRVVARLRKMKPKNNDAQEEIRKLIGYLQNHSHRIDYFKDLHQGFPIGSGGIESANKFICHTRLKRSGAWWVKEMGNAMLRVRCAMYNGTFDRVFRHYMKVQMKSNTARKSIQDE